MRAVRVIVPAPAVVRLTVAEGPTIKVLAHPPAVVRVVTEGIQGPPGQAIMEWASANW